MTSLDELAADIQTGIECLTPSHDHHRDNAETALTSLLTRAKDGEAQQPATVHRAEDGMMTLDWPDGQREVPVTRSLMEDIIQQLNQRTALERDRDTYRAALEVIAANEYDDSGDGPNYVTIARQATTTPDKPDKEKR
jgi:hypothetical protein